MARAPSIAEGAAALANSRLLRGLLGFELSSHPLRIDPIVPFEETGVSRSRPLRFVFQTN